MIGHPTSSTTSTTNSTRCSIVSTRLCRRCDEATYVDTLQTRHVRLMTCEKLRA